MSHRKKKVKTKHNQPKTKVLSSSKASQADKLVSQAMTFHRQGQLKEAEALYKQVLSLDKNNADANHLLGVIATQVGNIPLAIKLIEHSLTIQPLNALAHYNLGLALQTIHRCDKAAVCYVTALNINPGHIESMANLGSMYMYLGKHYDAEKTFRKAASSAPTRVDILNNLGLCLYEQGKLDSAQEYYKKVLALDEGNAEAYNNVACVQQKLGDLPSAVENYQEAVKLNSDYYAAYNNLALALEIQGNIDTALMTYRKVIEMQPKSVTAHTALAIHSWMAGELDTTEQHLSSISGYNEIEYSAKQNQFVKGYYQFILRLVAYRKENSDDYRSSVESGCSAKPIFIIGDSHCISYSGLNVKSESTTYEVDTKLVVGCKAWHLANESNNEFKCHFQSALATVPDGAQVAVVFGEIDCRVEEGILPFSTKSGVAVKDIVVPLVGAYTRYVFESCAEKSIVPWFLNVPAPIQKLEHSDEDKAALKQLVELFNCELARCVEEKSRDLEHPSRVFDVYQLSNDRDGFSSGEVHIDGVHLKPSALASLM